MTQSIGALVAELSANTASFQKDMGKAAQILNTHVGGMNRTLTGLENKITGLGKGLAAAFTVGAVTEFARSLIESGDHLNKLSEKTGISVEKLSEFVYGAKLAGTSVDDMANGLKKLAASMADAAANRGGQMAETFRALGIAVTDSNGKLRDTGVVFEELAQKFAGAEDGPNKVAIAVRLMGKSGEGLIPFANKLAETSAEARQLGVTTSTDFARSSEQFNDTLSRMGEKLAAFGRTALLPVIKLFNELHKDRSGSNLEEAVARLEGLIARVKKQAEEQASGGSLLSKMFKSDPKYLADLESQLAIARERLDKFRSEQKNKNEATQKNILPIIADAGQVNAFQRLLNDLEKATAEANAAMTLDDKKRSDERLAIAYKEFSDKAELAHLTADQQMQWNEKFLAYQKAAAARAAFDLRTPLQKLAEQWDNTSKQLENATAHWVDNMSDELTKFVITGKASFKDFALSVISDLVRIMIQKRLAGIFGNVLGSTGNAGGPEQLAGPGITVEARASGGPIAANRPYLVGEQGPEIMVPSMAGTMIPNGGFGGVSVTNVFNISTGVAETVRAEMMNMAPIIEERSKQGVLVAIERGGSYARAVGRRA